MSLYYLLFGDQDVPLQAGTGFGKSLIWQFVGRLMSCTLAKETLTIMISPLTSLTEQQVAVVNATPGLRGVSITQANSSDKLYLEIGAGEYTHGMHTFR